MLSVYLTLLVIIFIFLTQQRVQKHHEREREREGASYTGFLTTVNQQAVERGVMNDSDGGQEYEKTGERERESVCKSENVSACVCERE